jgi:hypothetical protein
MARVVLTGIAATKPVAPPRRGPLYRFKRRYYALGWNAALDAVGWDVVSLPPDSQKATIYREAARVIQDNARNTALKLEQKARDLEHKVEWTPDRQGRAA